MVLLVFNNRDNRTVGNCKEVLTVVQPMHIILNSTKAKSSLSHSCKETTVLPKIHKIKAVYYVTST